MIVKTTAQQHSQNVRQRAQGALRVWQNLALLPGDQLRPATQCKSVFIQADLPAQPSPSDLINFALPTTLSGTDLQPSIRGASPQVFAPH